MATLNFKGKSAVWNHHLSVPYHTLEQDKKKSLKGKNEAENLIIQGDNLLALKALLPQYQGKVKCIYIDPPYNTGDEGWVYSDNVSSPTIKEWVGKVVGKSGEDLTRHDKWLCMMAPRLKLLRELLSDDGVIFISIDDNEIDHLKSVADEIFSEDKYIGIITWFKKRKGSYLSKEFISLTEYIVAFKKTAASLHLFGGKPDEEESQPLVKRTNAQIKLRFAGDSVTTKLPDGILKKGKYGEGSSSVRLLNDIEIKKGFIKENFSLEGPFTWGQEMLNSELSKGAKITINTETLQPRVYRKYDEGHHKGLSSFIDGREVSATTDDAYEELQALFLTDRVFEYSKPRNLIKRLVNAVTFNDKSSIVLDSFAGSGTSAHAVLALNKDEKDALKEKLIKKEITKKQFDEQIDKVGNRKFILVEMEDYADKITAERVRRAIKKDGYDAGFTYQTLGSAIDAESLLSGKLPTYKEFAKYVYYLATGKNHPDESKIKEAEGYAGKGENEAIYLLYKPSVDALKTMAITLDWAQATHKKNKGRKIVYAPACYLDDEALDQYEIKFVSIPYNLFERVV